MKTFALFSALILCSTTAYAQREIAPSHVPQPGPNDTVIAGDELSRSVTCSNGNSIYIEGQRNEVQVHGFCSLVRIQGNRNHVWVERSTTVPVEGNDNTIFVSNPKTRYSSRGNGNRFENAKH